MAGRERRRATLAALACVLAACAACGSSSDGPTAASTPSSVAPPSGSPFGSISTSTPSGSPGLPSTSGSPAPTPTTAPVATLPRGGTTVFPRYRLVGYSGRTGASALGRLGIGGLDARMSEMIRRAKPYAADGRQVLPVAEVIATVVQASPGKDGKYRTRMSDHDVAVYLAAARRHKAVLLLNIQPGRAKFLDEVKAYRKWLVNPDVGLALDPEWAIGPDQIPGRVFGRTTGAELDEVASWVADLVQEKNLPEKVVVYHQLRVDIVRKESGLKKHTGVALVKSIDGIGPPGAKIETWKAITKGIPSFVHPGFKLFYDEDSQGASRLMTPAEVMALKPTPEYVLYE